MILVCGEALIDFFPAAFEPERSGSCSFHGRVGGSPYNVAYGLARLGVKSAFLSCFSDDLFGSKLRRFLADEGVDLTLSRTVARPTALAFVQTAADGSPQYAFLGEDAADRMLSTDMLPAYLPDEIQALSFGSFSLAVEPCGTAYEALMLREAPKRVIALDPNVRPRLVADMDIYRRRLEDMMCLSDIVKVSTEDLRELYGATADFFDIAGRWQREGVKLVVVTDGASGAHALLHGEWAFFAAEGTTVIDTVGAGDSFHSALLAGLHRAGYLTREALSSLSHEAIAPVISRASIAASITCSRQGADLPRLSDFQCCA